MSLPVRSVIIFMITKGSIDLMAWLNGNDTDDGPVYTPPPHHLVLHDEGQAQERGLMRRLGLDGTGHLSIAANSGLL